MVPEEILNQRPYLVRGDIQTVLPDFLHLMGEEYVGPDEPGCVGFDPLEVFFPGLQHPEFSFQGFHLFFRGQLPGEKLVFQFSGDFAQNKFKLPYGTFEHAYSFVEALQDSFLDSPGDPEMINCNEGGFLSDPVKTADPLLHFHRIPRKIVVEKNVGKLKVQAFRTDLGREHYLHRRIFPESVYERLAFFPPDIPVDRNGTDTLCSQSFLQVAQRTLEKGKNKNFGLLFFCPHVPDRSDKSVIL
ncbi:hypothetical protein SDC9_139358 [bioreactor metagenome]|uniref:Uncharacterized protein n=1 Tax=bioreactor metagenome TaxID=1076179 RepID=A0A645DUF0_9ZZZZ